MEKYEKAIEFINDANKEILRQILKDLIYYCANHDIENYIVDEFNL